MMGLEKTEVLRRCSDEAQTTLRTLMADYGVSFTGLVDALGLVLSEQNLLDPDLTVHLRPWITTARRLDASRRARP